jgi:hypothetical protein
LFVGAIEKHAQIVKFARSLKKLVPFRTGQIDLAVALELFFRALHSLHNFWRQKTLFTPTDLQNTGFDKEPNCLEIKNIFAYFPLSILLHWLLFMSNVFLIKARKHYLALATRLGEVWRSLGWKVSTWVHWAVCHSHALARVNRNFYMFSSIPTERRNVEFKLDITHCFKAWKLSNPQACTRGFALVLNLHALDVGLLLYAARKRGQKRKADDAV